MTELENRIWDLALVICNKHQLELLEVNYKKTKNNATLEIIIDKEGGVDLDDTTIVNQELGEVLDQLDPIPDSYCLEVSSAGCERELKTDKDLTKAIGNYVHLTTYEKQVIDNVQPKLSFKEIEGDLVGFDETNYTLLITLKQRQININVERKKVAKIRLAIKF